MKKNLRFAAGLLGFSMCFLTGCQNSLPDEEETTSVKKDYDIFIYNSDTDIGTAFRKMCDEYTDRTGVIIRTVTPKQEDNTVENLESYLTSEKPPNIFTVNNLEELKKWQSSSNIWDFSNATEEPFKEVVNDIPENLRLSSNNSDSFGLPYTVEAYGFLADPKMIASLFGGDKYRTVLNDLRECSYEEFFSFVQALKLYIKSSGIAEFTLNEKKYTFVQDKGEMSKNLNAVFSFAAGNSANSGTYLSNIALSAVFKSAGDANIATDADIESLNGPFLRFAETLDLITSNVSGANGELRRGLELVSSTQNSTTQAMKNFINGKSLFLLGGTKDYDNLSIFNSSVAKRCVFIPIKMPFLDQEVKASVSLTKNIHRSIPVYAPKYYAINAKSSARELKLAQDFLTWVKTSDLAEKYTIPEFGFIPYDIKESSVIDNPLGRSMIEYLSEGLTLPGAYYGAPSGWCNDTVGKYLIEQFFTKSGWSYQDYQKIADFCISKWKELKNQ